MMQALKINYKTFESKNETNWHEKCKECKHSIKEYHEWDTYKSHRCYDTVSSSVNGQRNVTMY